MDDDEKADKSRIQRPEPSARLSAARAAELVARVRMGPDQPFGPLKLVRAVIRQKRPQSP